MMIDKKEIEVHGKKYFISKFPATVGRELITQYPMTNLPKVGNYGESHKLMLKAMSYVAVEIEGQEIKLTTEELVNNHVPSGEALIKIEKEMFSHNFDFFTNGDLSTFLENVETVASQKLTGMLTTLLDKLSQAGKQLSEN